MTKRIAQSQMTKENCLNEDEHEDAGHFEQAAPVRLQNREIKKAKRRIEKNGVPSSPFQQFAGFVGTNKAPFSTFSFQAEAQKVNGKNPSETASAEKTFSKQNSLVQAKMPNLPATSEHSRKVCESEKTDRYLEKLKQLNVSFLNWVQEHMNKNVYCDFTPVCMDYVEHMKKLERPTESPAIKPLTSEATHKFSFISQSTPESAGKSPLTKSTQSTASKPPAVGFSFFAKKDDQIAQPSPAKPFSFSSSAVTKTENIAETDDDNYVPPKNEFQPVKEQDAIYSKRCKLFYKKGDNFVDKGVGTLYLKEDGDKVQLVVRADTSTGLILLNICLNSNLPMERLGKNNVLIVCIPNPPLDKKSEPVPTPFLFRVKTSDEADELLEKLNKYKSGLQC